MVAGPSRTEKSVPQVDGIGLTSGNVVLVALFFMCAAVVCCALTRRTGKSFFSLNCIGNLRASLHPPFAARS